MNYIVSAKDWQDNKKCNLDIKHIMEYLAQFYKFRVNKIYRKLGFTINDRRFDRFVNFLRCNQVSIYRIVRIEYLVISRHFEIMYRKRHYGNIGVLFYGY